jgi:hypothetical protein
VRVLMFLKVVDLQILAVVCLIDRYELAINQLLQQLVYVDVVVWEDLNLDVFRAILHAPSLVSDAPQAGKQKPRRKWYFREILIFEKIRLYDS